LADQRQHAQDVARVLYEAGVFITASDVLDALRECGLAFIHSTAVETYRELQDAR